MPIALRRLRVSCNCTKWRTERQMLSDNVIPTRTLLHYLAKLAFRIRGLSTLVNIVVASIIIICEVLSSSARNSLPAPIDHPYNKRP
jgi:hypothetical protein